MLQVIGEIFKILWKIIVFAVKLIPNACAFFYKLVAATFNFLGFASISNQFVAVLGGLAIASFYGLVFSIIPETIIYLLCPLTKKYKSLKNENEKRKYREKHTFLFLKLILKGIRKSQFNRQMIEKAKSEETSLLNNNVEEIAIENVIERCKSNNDVEENNVQIENDANTCTFAPTMHPNVIDADLPILFDEDVQELENEIKTNNTKTSGIKILYTSNIIGNALRNGTVVKRRLLQTDKPFLVDFSQQPPKEIITENTCDGLSVQATIKGQKIEMALEDPNLLNNPVLFNEMTKEELKELKEQLESDMKYKSTLKSFFTMNKKALELKKH